MVLLYLIKIYSFVILRDLIIVKTVNEEIIWR